jgi:hypothetical protein
MSWPNWNANAREREDKLGAFYKAIYMYIDTIKEKRIFKDYNNHDEQPTLLYQKSRQLRASYEKVNEIQELIERIYMEQLTDNQKDYATVKEKWTKFVATKRRVEKLMSDWEALIMRTRETVRRQRAAARSQTRRRNRSSRSRSGSARSRSRSRTA